MRIESLLETDSWKPSRPLLFTDISNDQHFSADLCRRSDLGLASDIVESPRK